MRNRVELEQRKIESGIPIMEALRLMDAHKIKLLLVTENDSYKGLLSIGDIQRAIIKNIQLSAPVNEIMRQNVRVSHESESKEVILARMLQWKTELMPVLRENGEIKEILLWDDVFEHKHDDTDQKLNAPVVIMAGGKGTRLKPITNIIPKPLVPVGEKPIIENIISNFLSAGCKDFLVTVNYKHKVIENFFAEIEDKPYTIQFAKEDKPLGTAGSLSLLREQLNDTFFISNCDILIDQDYRAIYNYHKDQKNELTLVASLKHYNIPYGTLETGEGGELISITEKPELTFKINSGMYVLEPELLDEIPDDEFFHITHLIEKIKDRNGKIGVFPISEKSWFDIGEWSEYQKTLSSFENRFTWSS
jgi:dTDP-glucose pyrophosphorylase